MNPYFLQHPFTPLCQKANLKYWFVMVPFVWLVLVGQVCGAMPERIVVLQDSLNTLQLQRDSLHDEQVVLQARADSLAKEVNVLKQKHVGGTASGQLALSLRQSLALTVTLEALYVEEMIVGQSIMEICSSLREVCDAEIDRLIGTLQNQPDSSIVVQLQMLRATRNALDAPSGRRLPQVTIDGDDTPDDIRLKTELMADVALQLQNQKADVDRQLKRLVEEQRLRGRVMSFTNEFGLFDEALPQGRSVVAQPASEGRTEQVERDPNMGIAGLVPPSVEDTKIEGMVPDVGLATTVDVGREVTLDALGRAESESGGELAVEIQRLRQKQQELIRQEKQVTDRVVRLQAYLQQLLEGQTP